MKTLDKKPNITLGYNLSPKDRLNALRQIRGMWKNKKPDPIKELKKIRKEMDRSR